MWLRELIARAMQQNPAKRFADAREMHAVLSGASLSAAKSAVSLDQQFDALVQEAEHKNAEAAQHVKARDFDSAVRVYESISVTRFRNQAGYQEAVNTRTRIQYLLKEILLRQLRRSH
jgi:hypothetical protein